jgi:hypothetical protein
MSLTILADPAHGFSELCFVADGRLSKNETVPLDLI